MKTQQIVPLELLFLALAPFSTATPELAPLLPRKSSRGLANVRSEEILGTSNLDTRIAERDECGVGYKACKNACIPILGVCCENGKGYCDVMTVCVDAGCCPIGKLCSDDPDGCLGSLVPCGADKTCIPDGKICCEDTGSYCEQGETCMNNGKYGYCAKGSSSTLPYASSLLTRPMPSTGSMSLTSASDFTSTSATTTESTSRSEESTSSTSTISSPGSFSSTSTDSTTSFASSGMQTSTSNAQSASTSTGSAASQTSEPGTSSRMQMSGLALISCGLAAIYCLL
uniref:Granulins domain-containing protein n=1 Tax=Bionectria ochroleuca TaxID=29856 RepID=A0A8H7K6Y6_BIOOC